MNSVSGRAAAARRPGRVLGLMKCAGVYIAMAVLAFGIAALASFRAPVTVGAATQQDCPEGTLPFLANFTLPSNVADPFNQLVEDIPSDAFNLEIVAVPGEVFTVWEVSACLSIATPAPGARGNNVSFTTPTPVPTSAALPLVTSFLTATPTLQRTVVATSTPAPPTATATVAVTPAIVSGIRPPSTGDAGLNEEGGSPYLLLMTIFALGGGLAIGTALRLRAARVVESGYREDC